MLKIRLARHGRKKAPFYRIVLTEHTKPSQHGYKTVLGRFNPLAHTMEAKVDEIKDWISKGAQPSERVAKLLFAHTKDDLFKKFFVERTRTKGKEAEEAKKAEVEAKVAAAKEKAAAEKEAAKEAKKAEAEAKVEAEKVEDIKEEEVKEEVKEDTKEEEVKEEVKEKAQAEDTQELKEENKKEAKE
jgi:small subunit ribosomal protein S16